MVLSPKKPKIFNNNKAKLHPVQMIKTKIINPVKLFLYEHIPRASTGAIPHA